MSNNATPLVASEIFGTPLLVESEKLATVLSALGPRLGIEGGFQPATPELRARESEQRLQAISAALQAPEQPIEVSYDSENDYFVAGSTAIIPVIGTLVQRGSWMSAMSGMVGYNQLKRSIVAAQNDARVEKIVYEFDSRGGQVTGAFDFADWLFEQRGVKPTVSVVNEFAASGGYLLAAAAAKTIVMPRTAYAGSIGVVVAHIDRSKEMQQVGRAVTFVYAGAEKVDGNEFSPLSERARKKLQANVERTYDLFVNSVSRYRGMDAAAIRDTKAGVFPAEEAVALGLADRIEAFDTELRNQVRGKPTGARMAVPVQEQEMSDQKTAEQVAAEHKAAVEAAEDAAKTRIKAITGSEEAKGRTALAEHLAFNTRMTADEAVAMLKVSAKETAEAPAPKTSALEAAMAAEGSPALKNPAPAPVKAKPVIDTQAIYAARNKVA